MLGVIGRSLDLGLGTLPFVSVPQALVSVDLVIILTQRATNLLPTLVLFAAVYHTSEKSKPYPKLRAPYITIIVNDFLNLNTKSNII